MKCNVKLYRLQRREDLFLAQNPSKGWRFTGDALCAVQLAQNEIHMIVHTYIPRNEWTRGRFLN